MQLFVFLLMMLSNHLFPLKVLIEVQEIHPLAVSFFHVTDDEVVLSSYNQLYIHEFHTDEI
jgi:hypothetical protein